MRSEKDGEIVIKPITDKYIESMAGVTGTKGKLLKAFAPSWEKVLRQDPTAPIFC